ncbi:hypothetical protein F5Y12DRAFT_791994 [Xylaria sp. FL1777]|nr:hypothetical protein F5Y12DRAFT_791994 [Xylaria sp. FL1777]
MTMRGDPHEGKISFASTTTDASDNGDGGNNNDEIMNEQLKLLVQQTVTDELSEINNAPLFTFPVLEHAKQLATSASTPAFSQYGLLAGDVRSLRGTSSDDPRIFYNVAAPSSIFICGSQGSGKSHTLSCILENCLIQSDRLGRLPRPLTGIVFHYDDYASDSHVSPCEAAYLGSDPTISVRVLCSPTNIRAVKDSYSGLDNVSVEALRLDQADLNTKRMLELMAFDRAQPLYAQVIQRILRDMRLSQQDKPGRFNYHEFISKLDGEPLSPDQKRGLRQRLDTLQSFMVPEQVNRLTNRGDERLGTNWTPKARELLIVDLSCPCVTASMACALFNICLSIFLAQEKSVGRVIALDEAHRYMGETSDCEVLTNSLLAAIRFQRHLGARIIISTQEPTISPKLLDLCSITIVHRFSSPDWLNVLTKHLAGISKVSRLTNKVASADNHDNEEDANCHGLRGIAVSPDDPILELFSQIVELRTGEALVFAPSAVASLEKRNLEFIPRKLAHRVLRVVMRARITADGGRSIMAS